ncbi:hypothetical protein PpBr36_05277 [Pyricularia pennisetigena]|nr:hypothetical protein PpBr36_05277 [Pyricularia pennisetigena]TLS26198.1 hypothetical protein PpBr36_05277 [Pyricularia pennisetigena]
MVNNPNVKIVSAGSTPTTVVNKNVSLSIWIYGFRDFFIDP